MKNSSIRISNKGNTIRLTGEAANEFFKSLSKANDQKPLPPQYDNQRVCSGCGCVVDKDGCGCNPHDA
jgi:hypothetical protein